MHDETYVGGKTRGKGRHFMGNKVPVVSLVERGGKVRSQVVNNRWATLFVVLSSFLSPLIQYDGDPDYRSIGVFVWNLITRLILLEILILTIGRIRCEFSKHDDKVG